MNLKIRSAWLVAMIAIMFASVSGLSVQAETKFVSETSLLSSTETGVKFEIVVPWKSLRQEIIEQAGHSYLGVYLPEWSNMSQAGAPALPFMTQAIGAPFGVNLSVKVVPGKAHTIELSAPVIPSATQEMVIVSAEDLETNPYAHLLKPNPEIYEAEGSYPGNLAEISNDGVVRQQRIAGIGIYPLQYQPKSNTLTIYESLQVEVAFEGTSTTLQGAARLESDFYEGFFQSALMNYEQSQPWRSLPDQVSYLDNAAADLNILSDAGALPWQPPEPGWRVSIEEEGLYKLTYAELQLAGLPVDQINPQTFQMFTLGNEMAIQVSGEADLSFDENDYILFYGQGINNKYTQQNVYWLTYGNSTGLRMEVRDGTPLGENTPLYYSAQLHLEENHWYRSLVPGEDEFEHFFWEMVHTSLLGGLWSHEFYIEEPYEAVADTLQIALFGSLRVPEINPDHHAIVSINGTQVADVEWDGFTWAGDGFVDAEIPAGVLLPGLNTLSVFLPNDTGHLSDFIFVDWATINYLNTFSVNTGEDELAFSYDVSGTWQFQLSGFSSDALDVYDVSDPLEVAVFDRDSLTIGTTGSDYNLAFEDEIASEKDYLAAAESTIQTVLHADIVEDDASDLQSTANQADYILISHAAFMEEAETLRAYRALQGLSTILVDVQDVYDEFGFGIVSATAIREFLAYTAVNWQAPAPSFVVLVGDGNYDPKNYLGHNRTSYIPPYLALADPWTGETAADNRYVTFSALESLPDMMLGRLSVNSPAEAGIFVEKIIAYEQASSDEEWRERILTVASTADSAGDFPGYSDSLIADTLPEPYQAEKVHFGVTHTNITEAAAAVRAGINEGKLLVNFIGHGFTKGWSARNNVSFFIQTADVPELTNEGKYPVFLAMTCREGYFIDPNPVNEAFGEVVTRTENKGAIASWSPTGDGVSSGHDYMNRGFFEAVFGDGADVLGEAVAKGLTRLWLSRSNLYLLETYELFGDPALIINRKPAAVNDFYGTAEDYPLVVNTANGVLKNDFGLARGNSLTASLNTGVSNGVLELSADGSFNYTPNQDWYGVDSFTYDLYDDTTLIGTALVTITVYPVNDKPVADPQSVVTNMNTSVAIVLTGSDVEGSALTYSIKTAPAHGALSGEAPNLTYTPNAGFSGTDSFTFVVNDGMLNSDPATITIIVNPSQYSCYLPVIIR